MWVLQIFWFRRKKLDEILTYLLKYYTRKGEQKAIADTSRG